MIMKFTIESIRKMYQDDQIERERRRARIESKSQELEGLKSQLAEYGRLGQVDEYVATKRQIRDLEDTIEALQLQEEQKSFGEAEAREAWSDIAKDYSKSLDKDYAEYKKQLSEVARMYADIVKKQNKILWARHDLAELTGISPDNHGNWANPTLEYSLFPMRYIPERPIANFPASCNVECPELGFFIESGIWKNENDKEVEILNKVVRLHEPIDDVTL